MWQLGLERKDARDLTYYYVGGNGHRLETMLFFKPTMTPTPLRSGRRGLPRVYKVMLPESYYLVDININLLTYGLCT